MSKQVKRRFIKILIGIIWATLSFGPLVLIIDLANSQGAMQHDYNSMLQLKTIISSFQDSQVLYYQYLADKGKKNMLYEKFDLINQNIITYPDKNIANQLLNELKNIRAMTNLLVNLDHLTNISTVHINEKMKKINENIKKINDEKMDSILAMQLHSSTRIKIIIAVFIVIMTLAGIVLAMTFRTLDLYVQTLRAKNKAEIEKVASDAVIKNNNDLARAMQEALLPNIDINNEVFTAAYFSEACEEAGGDGIEVLPDGTKTLYSIWDVCGHGVKSCFMSAMFISALRALKYAGIDDLILMGKAINSAIQPISEKLDAGFITYLLLTIQDSGNCEYAGCHTPILYHKKNKKNIDEIETNDNKTGIWINTLSSKAYDLLNFKSKYLNLKNGDYLVLYTDGITEAESKTEKKYYDDDFKKNLIGLLSQGLKPLEVQQKIIEELKDRYKVGDDVTFLIIQKKEDKNNDK